MCREEDLRGGEVRSASLGRDGEGRPFLALVLRDEGGAVVAYRNLCRHLPVPLDGGTGRVLDERGRHLVCGTHGATYRLRDGLCVDGPCEGLALLRLPTRTEGGWVYVRAPGPQG